MSFNPRCMSGLSASLLIKLCASSALMIAFSSSLFRSGDVANCCLELFAARWRNVPDSSRLSIDAVHVQQLGADSAGHVAGSTVVSEQEESRFETSATAFAFSRDSAGSH